MSVRPFPRAKKPRPGNRAESSKPRARAAIQSGNLRSSQAPGTPEQGDGYGLGRRPRLPYPAGCTRKLVTGGLGSSCEGGGGKTASLMTLAPAASRTHSCAPTRKPGFRYSPDSEEGRATGAGRGARLSGILEPLGRLQWAAFQLRPRAQRSQGLGVNQVGHEERTSLDGVFLQMKTDECHRVSPLTPSVFTGEHLSKINAAERGRKMAQSQDERYT